MADTGWMARAACRPHVEAGNDLWFGNEHQRDQAIAICDGCPVREPCLDYAVGPGRMYGQAVAGGLDPKQLGAEARRRGLPRHGSTTGYTRDGCRCSECRGAMSEAQYRTSVRRAEDQGHACSTGAHPLPTVTCYEKHRCRCPLCRAENAKKAARYRKTAA